MYLIRRSSGYSTSLMSVNMMTDRSTHIHRENGDLDDVSAVSPQYVAMCKDKPVRMRWRSRLQGRFSAQPSALTRRMMTFDLWTHGGWRLADAGGRRY